MADRGVSKLTVFESSVLHRLQTHCLPLYFPEIARFQQNSRGDWFFCLPRSFPVPASITAMEKAQFIEAAWSVVGRKFAKAQLLGDIYE